VKAVPFYLLVVGAFLALVGIYTISQAHGEEASEYVFSGTLALIGAAGMLLTGVLFPLTRSRSR
jgi:uncharacterized membrane protein